MDGLTYVWIPSGTFRMGCSPDDSECFDNEKPAHTVTLTKGFWIGQTAVTQAAYSKVMDGSCQSKRSYGRMPRSIVSA
jgi:formylglycine-generating enzyme required for sulfatase activity